MIKMDETFYNEKLYAQESLEEGYITIDEYNELIEEIESQEDEYYNDDW